MITTAKAISQKEEQNLIPNVYFLNLDGSVEYEKSPILYNSAFYVSNTDDKKYGKIEVLNGKFTFFLKQYRGGRPGELLVDPYGMLSKPEDLSAFTSQRGHRFCEYIKVKESIFNEYRQYLKDRNPLRFRSCEASILNGDNYES